MCFFPGHESRQYHTISSATYPRMISTTCWIWESSSIISIDGYPSQLQNAGFWFCRHLAIILQSIYFFCQKCWSTNMLGIRLQNRAFPPQRPPRSSDRVQVRLSTISSTFFLFCTFWLCESMSRFLIWCKYGRWRNPETLKLTTRFHLWSWLLSVKIRGGRSKGSEIRVERGNVQWSFITCFSLGEFRRVSAIIRHTQPNLMKVEVRTIQAPPPFRQLRIWGLLSTTEVFMIHIPRYTLRGPGPVCNNKLRIEEDIWKPQNLASAAVLLHDSFISGSNTDEHTIMSHLAECSPYDIVPKPKRRFQFSKIGTADVPR